MKTKPILLVLSAITASTLLSHCVAVPYGPEPAGVHSLPPAVYDGGPAYCYRDRSLGYYPIYQQDVIVDGYGIPRHRVSHQELRPINEREHHELLLRRKHERDGQNHHH